MQQQIREAFAQGTVLELPNGDVPVSGVFLSDLVTGLEPVSIGPRAALRIKGARVTGRFDLEGCEVAVPISFEECLFEESPNLVDSRVSALKLTSSHAPGIDAAGIETRGDLSLDGIVCVGQLNLLGARIGGALRLSNASVSNDVDAGVMLSRASIAGGVFAGGLSVFGQLRMISLRVGGLLNLRGAILYHPLRVAVQAERLQVGESLFLQRARVTGRVFLQNASITGGLDLERVVVEHLGDRSAINLVRSRVSRNISFSSARVNGSADLLGVTAVGLSMNGAEFTGEGAELSLQHAEARRVRLRFSLPPTLVKLGHAKFEVIEDCVECWPEKLEIESCAYEVLTTPEVLDVKTRLHWLRRGTTHYAPGPYEMLAGMYRRLGDEQSAKLVLLEKERARRRTLALGGKVAGYFLDGTVGYGYRTWIAGIWLLLFLTAGSVVFHLHPTVPSDPAKVPTVFHPIVYSLDLLLPIIDLGQEKSWVPMPSVQWLAWVLTIVGWGLTTAVVAGLSKLLSRRP